MLTKAAAAVDADAGSSGESSGSEYGGPGSGVGAKAKKSIAHRKTPSTASLMGGESKACFNCDTRKTTAWRRDADMNLLCGYPSSAIFLFGGWKTGLTLS
jgi:hypothetical protein